MTSIRCSHFARRLVSALACVLIPIAARSEESSIKATVRDVNVYVMSSYGTALNHRDLYRSTLPGFTSPKRTTAERKHLLEPSPAGLITFEGEPSPDVDVLIEFDNGRFFAAWPPATQRSKRLLWAHGKLTKEAGTPPALPEGHWLTHLRSADRLWLDAGRRNDRFILYDCELPLGPPLKVSSAEGGYGLTNMGRFPLHDVVVYRPEGDGWISAPLEKLESTAKKEEKKPDEPNAKPSPEAVFEDKAAATPEEAKKAEAEKAAAAANAAAEAAKAAATVTEVKAAAAVAAPVAVPVPAPPGTAPAAQPGAPGQPPAAPAIEEKVVKVAASKEARSKADIVKSWREMLLARGLGEPEAAHVVAILEKQALRKDSATIVFRLDDEQIDSLLPIEITPTPTKQVRVAMVILLDADPDLMLRVEELVKQLGDPDYTKREAAEIRLRKLGPAAKPKLQEAVNNADPEISFRAEELIESFDFPDAANPAAAAGATDLLLIDN
jgi:hypothetical protein